MVSNKGVRPRAPVAGIRSAAWDARQSPAQSKAGFEPCKRNDGEIFFGHSCGFRHQFHHVRHLLPQMRRDGSAGVEENRNFKLRPVRASKALKIADDNILVDDSKVAGLQGGHAVIVLVCRGKAQPNFRRLGAVGEIGWISRDGAGNSLRKTATEAAKNGAKIDSMAIPTTSAFRRKL